MDGARNLIRNIYFENYGCPSNRSDLEIMLNYLTAAGFKLIDNIGLADVVLINTCAVKKPTEDRMLSRLRYFRSLGKPVIVTGCLPKVNLQAIRGVLGGRFVALDPRSIDKVVYAVESVYADRETLIFSEEPPVKPALGKFRLNPIVEVVQVAEGCAGACTYCCVRFARGRLRSFPLESILDRIEKAVKEGVREVWLTGQDLGAYGLDLGVDLIDLLEGIKGVEGDFFVRLGMINPIWFRRLLDRLEKAIRDDERIFRFLHIPVQSGDDKVLKDMNRGYTAGEFKCVISRLREGIPRVSISTDVICGFPSETEEAFERTLKLIEEVKPDFLNVSKFFPRPGTPLWKEKTLPPKIVKERSKALTELYRRLSYERNRSWVGWEGEILVDEKGKGESWVGRNFAYKPIVVQCDGELLGETLRVKVVDACSTYLKARIVG